MSGRPLLSPDHADPSAGDTGAGAHLGERRRGFAGDPCPHCDDDLAHPLPACPGPWPGDCDECYLAALPPRTLRPLREELLEQLAARRTSLLVGRMIVACHLIDNAAVVRPRHLGMVGLAGWRGIYEFPPAADDAHVGQHEASPGGDYCFACEAYRASRHAPHTAST